MLPSEYTPSDLRQTELFIKGTEPTTISTRFSKLNDVSNLKAEVDKDVITLTWDRVNMPDINTEIYLREQFSKLFNKEDYLNSYINNRMNYINNQIGNIGYNIYSKDSNGDLKLIDFVSTNKYEIKPDTSGEYTYIVKTAYSIFKNNMSDGKSVKINVKIASPIIPNPDDTTTEKPENNSNNKEESNN